MAECYNKSYDENAANSDTYGSEAGEPHAETRFKPSADEDARIEREYITQRQAKAEAEQNVIDGIASGAIQPGYRLPAGIEKALAKLATEEQRKYEVWRRAAEQAALEENKRVLNRIGQSAQAESGLWLRLASWFNEKFVDRNAPLAKFFLNLFPEEGRGAENNTGVAVLSSSINGIVGNKRYFDKLHSEILHEANKDCAKIPSMDGGTLLDKIGIVINCRQAKSRNDVLYSRWRLEADELRRKAAELEPGEERSALMSDAAALEFKAKRLRENRHLDKQPSGEEAKKVVCCGYLDGEAARIESDILAEFDKAGIARSLVDKYYGRMYGVYQKAEELLIKAGQISESQIRRMPKIEGFMPFVPYMDNLAESMSNIDVYQPGSFKAMHGMTENPASAWHAIRHFTNRAAYRAGGVHLAQLLYNMHQKKGDLSGIRVEKFGNVNRMSNYAFNQYLRKTSNEYSGGGIVSDVLVNAKGDREKVFIQFDQRLLNKANGNKEWSIHSAKELNALLGGLGKSADKVGLLGKMTGAMGQMYTKWSAGFAPINGLRDFGERVVNMINRDYIAEDGTHIAGYQLVGGMSANVLTAKKILFDAVRGKLDPNTEAGRFYAEYIQQGCDPVMIRDLGAPGQGLDTVVGRKKAPLFPELEGKINIPDGLKEAAKTAGVYSSTFNNWVNAYNSWFNNIAPLSQFIAMRKRGMSARAAGNAVNEMLNNNIGGTALQTLRAVFPFARPTLQGARAMLRSFGLGVDASGKFQAPDRRAVATMIGTYAAGSMLYGFARDSLGEDDSGALNADSLSVSQLASSIPFPTSDGHYLRIPVPFGIPRIALALAVAKDRAERGVIDPEDAAFAAMAQVAKNVSPQSFPEYAAKENPAAWLLQAFSPELLRPAVDVAVNRNYRGRPISYKAGGGDEGMEPKAASGYATTNPAYKKLALDILGATGYDLAPEQVQAIVKGYTGGVGQLFRSFIESENPAIQEERKTAAQEMGNFLAAMGGTMYYGRALDADKTLFYEAKARLESDVRRENVEWNNEELRKKKDPDAYRRWRVQQLRDKGWSEAKLQDLDTMLQADALIRKSHQNWRKPLLDAFNADDDGTKLKETFRKKFDGEADYYSGAVSNMNLYHGGWE